MEKPEGTPYGGTLLYLGREMRIVLYPRPYLIKTERLIL